ncbi:hypothetical protein BHF71_08680 [Vulcanibacillus modesticaldus]|uniref:histidine kinase n=1 Tax=Vulcanibacillus modesticaldus TaxID=337097 RepID=A0A1D2YV35_9BACI|nr:HAMP domain-containing sensor histidine kinase [Vulcanibacillus modesticaldus]OEF99547.1 hypothetical protein BHF71_08680 [Vulcanibacillus modesticaldus]
MSFSIIFLFFILWILLWTVAFIVVNTDSKNEYNRWLGLFTFLAGFGGLAVFIREFIELIKIIGVQIPTIDGIFSSFAHYLAPYALLMFAIINTEIFRNRWDKWKNRIAIILLIPPLLSYILFPVYPKFSPSYTFIVFWAVGYIVIANLMFIYSWITTQNPRQKINQLFTCVLFVPALTFVAFSNYILPALNIQNIWIYNSWIVILLFILFIFFGWKYGVLGVKIKFEKYSLDNTMRAMTSGTAILNHTLKNEVVKISVCIEELKKIIKEYNIPTKDYIDIITNSTEHIMDMIKRLNTSMQDIEVKEQAVNLANVIELSVHNMKSTFEKNNVKIKKNLRDDIILIFDRVHLREMINNILMNSVEAIHSAGEINIEMTINPKYLTLAIKDNGIGISKNNLSNIFDPFFSTKKKSSNFGLGLTYCYNVMQKSGGYLEIDSKENIGTTVYLNFPIKKVFTKYSIDEVREE